MAMNRRTRVRTRSRRGFTLISMLVALVLLTVGVMALAQANAATITVSTRTANRGVALSVGRAYLEELRTRDPWSLQNEPAVRVDATGTPAANGAYTRSMQATVLRPNLLQLRVIIEYPNPTGPISLETYLYRPNGLVAP
jgi:Tfp pilus assembly protein PilV